MESIEARAFKSSSFISEVAVKPAEQQAALVDGDDYLLVSPLSAAGEDFSFEEFIDLQGLSEGEGEDEEEKSSSSSSTLSLSSHDHVDDERSSFSGEVPVNGVSSCITDADGLAIPADDIKELELWSHLMDDTICDDIFAYPARNVYVKTGPSAEKRVRFEPVRKPATVEATRFPPPIPSKPRSKRFRVNRGAWFNSWLLEPVSSTSPSLPSSEPGSAPLEAAQEPKSRKPGVKGLKRKPAALENDGSPAGPVQQRRCTHCQVQKTPQWRAGPLGPKTLCNACGVRFKSGRLFPEYRPACSPTFSSEIHSNSHRKVIEMRKRKTAEPSGLGLAPSILSC